LSILKISWIIVGWGLHGAARGWSRAPRSHVSPPGR
jgi:hypothetical protein